MVKVEKLEKGTYFDEAYKLTFKYNAVTVSKVKSLSQKRYLPDERAWEIPAHELENLIKVLDGQIEASDEIMQGLKDNVIKDKRESTQDRLRGIKPVKEFEFKTKPLPHQIEAFNYGNTHNAVLLGDQQGLGKTKESIDICVSRKSELNKCLIVCGVNSVKYNWMEEVEKHSYESCVMVDGKTMPKRVSQIYDWYNSDSYFAVINIESLRNTDIQDALLLGIGNKTIGAVIVDEVHKAKNGQSQQGKALRLLRTKVRLGLTGTPIMSRAEDLWNILTWLGAEKRNVWAFRNAYCIMGGYGGYKVVGHKNLDELNSILNRVMLRRTKAEVLDLPPKTYLTEYVELPRKSQLLYKQIKDGLVEELEEILENPNPLTSTLRLRQVTSGDPNLVEENPKLDRIMEILEDEIIPNGEKAIIFSQWSTIAESVNERLSEYNPILITGEVEPAKRQELVNHFQNDTNCKVAIGTIGAMGTGLTLNKANHVFFMDKAWTSGENEQAEDRAHRIGTTGTVNIISMVCKNTIDEGIEEYLRENKDLFDRIVDGKGKTMDMRALLNSLLKI